MQQRRTPGRRTAGRRSRQARYHHGDLRAAAVAAALAALDGGEPLPPLRVVAARCGVAHPSLYRHFSNLEDLTLSVAAACFRDFHAAIRLAIDIRQEPYARLRAGCEASIRWGLAHPARYALMTGPELAGRQHHDEFFGAARETFDSLVEAVGACGVRDAVPVAHIVMCALHGLTDFLRKGRTIPHAAASIDGQIASMTEMAVAYVRTSRHRRRPRGFPPDVLRDSAAAVPDRPRDGTR